MRARPAVSTMAALVIAAVLCGGAQAATIAPSTRADVINPDDGTCSLREAVIAANTDTSSGAAPGECPAGSGTDTIALTAGAGLPTRRRPGRHRDGP